jgi:Sir2- and TIR-associating SLOG family
MRPFPQVKTSGTNLADQWRSYRKAMIDHAGIVVFVFGNKIAPDGSIIPSNGMREEFDLAIETGLKPLPVGVTGFMAEELWCEVGADFDTFFPGVNTYFRDLFDNLGDSSKTPSELIEILSQMILQLQGA